MRRRCAHKCEAISVFQRLRGLAVYVVGQPYRYACAMKNGFPVYEMTTVKEIQAEHLVLENGVRIDYQRVGRLDPDPRLRKE